MYLRPTSLRLRLTWLDRVVAALTLALWIGGLLTIAVDAMISG